MDAIEAKARADNRPLTVLEMEEIDMINSVEGLKRAGLMPAEK